ncbi:MAG: energy transducer TonB [Melioribacteraceae bacterium]|nr:energy transducer TonB [Melioribacteraceae bacterium]
MNSRKSVIVIVVLLIIVSFNFIIAQDKKELDKVPMPVGGMETILKNVVYPEDAKKNKIEGKVLVKVLIDEEGNVVEAKIEKGENKLLCSAAEKAVKATKFTPGEKDGKKVKAEVIVPIFFKLS